VQYLPERKLWLNVADYRQCSVPIALSVEFPDEGNEIAARLKRLEILRIDDTSTFEDKSNRNHVQFPGAWLLVPLHFRSSLWGCLCLMLENRPHHWQNSEVELACAVADQLMMAIQQSEYQQVQRLNADLERQVQERTAQLQQALNFEAMLKRITDKVRDSLEESQILQTVGQELAQGLRVNRCDTALYNADQTNACICYEYTTSSPPSFQGCVVQMAEFPEVFYQLLQGQCFQFCEIGSNPIWRHGTTLVCPIFDAQGVLGDLWLLKHKDEAFNELEIRLVQQVANQCAIAIRQARITREVQAQVEELAKLNRLKDDFLSTVSHELRTPMVNIKMAIFMLTVAFNQDSSLTQQSRVHRYLQILEDESAREINLINDLLDLQQLETGKQTLALEKIHLQSWLLKEIEPFKERFRNRQQTLRLDIPPTLPHLVSDPSSLSRILAELLNNACKYTPPGEQITVTAEAILGRILLKVLNSGTEIPNCELPHIFNKFYRIPSTDPWKQSGTGLGLALVQKLIENLGVTIKVESASNQTCFTLELPLTVSNTGGGAPA
jgi:signal transduction histidine kinase